MSALKEEESKFAQQIVELIGNESLCEQLNTVLISVAARRDPTLHAALQKDGLLPANVPSAAPPRFEDDEKNIMMYIERNKNKNVVVYRGMLAEGGVPSEKLSSSAKKAGGGEGVFDENAALSGGNNTNKLPPKLHDKEPLDAFWLDIDPEYKAANRKKGVMTNRCELNVVDRNMAYGVSVATHKPNEAVQQALAQKIGGGSSSSSCPLIDPRVFPVSFVALTGRIHFQALAAVRTGCAAKPLVYLPIIFGFINGKLCVVERIYVQAKEGGMFSLPKVQHVDVFGFEVPTAASGGNGNAAEVTERLSP